MSTYQDRVLLERDELRAKFDRLVAFLGGDLFKGLPDDEQFLLTRQKQIMHEYLCVLDQRIAHFKQFAV